MKYAPLIERAYTLMLKFLGESETFSVKKPFQRKVCRNQQAH